ncbi:hypothetical protein XENOCAPTIV_001045 [Xenoophorus captivus]|uniref:Uncharacterized protein n=1 Tax=Xenoophorus captivus TaxID=1517983 RepID=A0ABV0S4E5_9TELE
MQVTVEMTHSYVTKERGISVLFLTQTPTMGRAQERLPSQPPYHICHHTLEENNLRLTVIVCTVGVWWNDQRWRLDRQVRGRQVIVWRRSLISGGRFWERIGDSQQLSHGGVL